MRARSQCQLEGVRGHQLSLEPGLSLTWSCQPGFCLDSALAALGPQVNVGCCLLCRDPCQGQRVSARPRGPGSSSPCPATAEAEKKTSRSRRRPVSLMGFPPQRLVSISMTLATLTICHSARHPSGDRKVPRWPLYHFFWIRQDGAFTQCGLLWLELVLPPLARCSAIKAKPKST